MKKYRELCKISDGFKKHYDTDVNLSTKTEEIEIYYDYNFHDCNEILSTFIISNIIISRYYLKVKKIGTNCKATPDTR